MIFHDLPIVLGMHAGTSRADAYAVVSKQAEPVKMFTKH